MRSAWVLTGLIRSVSLWLVLLAASPALAYTPSSSQEVGLERTGPGTFSIDVEGADIRTVCRAISEFSGRNIVVAQQARMHNLGRSDRDPRVVIGAAIRLQQRGRDPQRAGQILVDPRQ